MDAAQLQSWMREGSPPGKARAIFDALAPVTPQAMTGTWRGRSLATGHPLDGLLEGLGWYGKRFMADGTAHPLLFAEPGGRVVALEPALMPLFLVRHWPGLGRKRVTRRLFSSVMPLCRARKPGARLETVTFRAVASAAMVYERLPITDHLRTIDPNRVVGWMELERARQPFFFMLQREPASMESA